MKVVNEEDQNSGKLIFYYPLEAVSARNWGKYGLDHSFTLTPEKEGRAIVNECVCLYVCLSVLAHKNYTLYFTSGGIYLWFSPP